MDNCVFCDIISGKREDHKLWENEDFLLLLEINPIKPGHCMLIPKKHVGDVFDLDTETYLKLFSTIKDLSGPIKKARNAKRVGVAIVGFAVDHAHVHLVPLHKSGEMFEGSDTYKASKEELNESSERILKELK